MQTEHNRQLLEIQQNHRKEMAEKSVRHKDEVSGLKRIIEKLCAWFPMAKEIMRIESLHRIQFQQPVYRRHLLSRRPGRILWRGAGGQTDGRRG